MNNQFKYYKKEDTQQERFYRVPKIFIEDGYFRTELNNNMKLMYALVRDRYELSMSNNWVDKEGNVYCIYSRENLMEDLGISKNNVTKCIKKLAEMNLLKEVRYGQGKPNKIYISKIDENSRLPEKEIQDSLKKGGNDTELSETEKHKGCEQDSPRLFYKYSTEKEIQTPISNVVLYYLDMYAEYMGKNHPRLKGHQWDNVVYRLETAYKDDFIKDHYADEHVIKYMIDKHFKTAYPNCDYNILHFISDEVFKNRYYETDRYLNESDI